MANAISLPFLEEEDPLGKDSVSVLLFSSSSSSSESPESVSSLSDFLAAHALKSWENNQIDLDILHQIIFHIRNKGYVYSKTSMILRKNKNKTFGYSVQLVQGRQEFFSGDPLVFQFPFLYFY